MSNAPLVLGINRTQDASICLMQGWRLLWAIQKERLSRHKHDAGRLGDFRDVYGSRLPWPAVPIDVVVECAPSDGAAGDPAQYDDELSATLRLMPGYRHARISHHLAHALSAFQPSPFHDAAVMIVDGQGSLVAELTDHWSGAVYAPGNWREVASFYRADRTRLHCIGKQLWDRDDTHPVGLGRFYALLTQTIFPGTDNDNDDDNDDKVMDLAPHGDARALGLPPLDVQDGQVRIPEAWRTTLQEGMRFRYGQPGVAFADCANLAAAGQRAYEDALLSLARWLHAETGLDNLCFAGSAALNTSANARLLHETPFKAVFIPPAPGSAGTALGCALYGMSELAHASSAYRWTRNDLGPMHDGREVALAVSDQGDLHVEQTLRPDVLIERTLELLRSQRVVALYQGGSEFGPHALANRSILADPRHAGMRDWINARVTQREWFHPLTAVVLEERAAAWFGVDTPPPFMQYAVPVRPQQALQVPAIVHADGSACVQAVRPGDNDLLHSLLRGFETHTGVPILLNTEFRSKDEPIVETPADAIAAFRRMPVHALVMPPYVVTKQVEPDLP